MFQSLSSRNYRIYATGALVSNIGTWMFRTAVTWLALEVGGGGTAVGLVMASQAAPLLIFAPLAGTVADRVNKQSALLVAQLGMVVPVGAMAALSIAESAAPWHLYLLSFVFGVARAFEVPIRHSFVSELVSGPTLANAIALNSASFNVGRLTGPAVAGLLIALMGSGERATGWVILVNALSYFAIIASLLLLDRSDIEAAVKSTKLERSFRAGLTYLRGRPDLLFILIVVLLVSTFSMNFQITSSLMVTQVFGLGADVYGAVGSIVAIGSLAGALVAARWQGSTPRRIVVFGVIFAFLCMLAGIMPTLESYAILLPAQGVCVLIVLTSANTYIQTTSLAAYRGRMASLYGIVFWGGTPFGGPLIGWIGEAFGGRWSLLIGGGLSVLGLAIVSLWYWRRNFRALAPVPGT